MHFPLARERPRDCRRRLIETRDWGRVSCRISCRARRSQSCHRDLVVRCFSTPEISRRHVPTAPDALYHRLMKPRIDTHPILFVLRNTICRSKMRSAMRTAARTGTKYVVERADTSIFLRGSECQLGLLPALDLAPHGARNNWIIYTILKD